MERIYYSQLDQLFEALDKWLRIVYQRNNRDEVDIYGNLIVIIYYVFAKKQVHRMGMAAAE